MLRLWPGRAPSTVTPFSLARAAPYRVATPSAQRGGPQCCGEAWVSHAGPPPWPPLIAALSGAPPCFRLCQCRSTSPCLAPPPCRSTSSASRRRPSRRAAIRKACSTPSTPAVPAIPADDRATKQMAARLQVYGFITLDEVQADGSARRLRPSEAVEASLARPARCRFLRREPRRLGVVRRALPPARGQGREGSPVPEGAVLEPVHGKICRVVRIFCREILVDVDAVTRRIARVKQTLAEAVGMREYGIRLVVCRMYS